jgi:uncharacterized protein YbcI
MIDPRKVRQPVALGAEHPSNFDPVWPPASRALRRRPRVWRIRLFAFHGAQAAGGSLALKRPMDLRRLCLSGELSTETSESSAMAASDGTEAGAMSEISRDLVRLHSEYYGKGPTRARTYMVSDTVMSILEGGFTTVEATLIAEGKAEAVHDMRRSFQTAMEERFRAVVEKATGRNVIAYMSQIHTNPDLAVELFVLGPAAQRLVAEQEVELGGEPETRRSSI